MSVIWIVRKDTGGMFRVTHTLDYTTFPLAMSEMAAQAICDILNAEAAKE